MQVSLVHDYLTQRGGAERVVLSMVKAFPEAPLYTSIYEPETTFPGFRHADVRTSVLDIPLFRRNHRLAFPLLAPTFSTFRVEGDVVLCSSSGWAHGVRSESTKVVYCYSPARWLYQSERYLPSGNGSVFARAALSALQPPLVRWDRRAARKADRYLTSSAAVQAHIRAAYGIDAEILPPPLPIHAVGPRQELDGLEPGFFLCVSRLLPYKNVDAILEAFETLPRERLAVVGAGPEEARLRAGAPDNVRFLGAVDDDELRWLYGNAAGVIAASYEDYGLTPLEGAALGRPAAVLRWGGFVETVLEGETGVFFDRPEPVLIRQAVKQIVHRRWDRKTLESHAGRFSEERFVARLREVVSEECGLAASRNGDPQSLSSVSLTA